MPRAIAGVHAPLARLARRAVHLHPLQPLLLRDHRLVCLLVRLALRRPLLLALGGDSSLLGLRGKPLPLGVAALTQEGGVLRGLAPSALLPLDAKVVLRQLGDLLVVLVLAVATRCAPLHGQPVRLVRTTLFDL